MGGDEQPVREALCIPASAIQAARRVGRLQQPLESAFKLSINLPSKGESLLRKRSAFQYLRHGQ